MFGLGWLLGYKFGKAEADTKFSNLNKHEFDRLILERARMAALSDEELTRTYQPKFKVGDTVRLMEQYMEPARGRGNPTSGKITQHFADREQIKIGASYNVYVIDGVGTYGEAALNKI